MNSCNSVKARQRLVPAATKHRIIAPQDVNARYLTCCWSSSAVFRRAMREFPSGMEILPDLACRRWGAKDTIWTAPGLPVSRLLSQHGRAHLRLPCLWVLFSGFHTPWQLRVTPCTRSSRASSTAAS